MPNKVEIAQQQAALARRREFQQTLTPEEQRLEDLRLAQERARKRALITGEAAYDGLKEGVEAGK